MTLQVCFNYFKKFFQEVKKLQILGCLALYCYGALKHISIKFIHSIEVRLMQISSLKFSSKWALWIAETNIIIRVEEKLPRNLLILSLVFVLNGYSLHMVATSGNFLTWKYLSEMINISWDYCLDICLCAYGLSKDYL